MTAPVPLRNKLRDLIAIKQTTRAPPAALKGLGDRGRTTLTRREERLERARRRSSLVMMAELMY